MDSANHRCVCAASQLSDGDDSNTFGFTRTKTAETASADGVFTGEGGPHRYRGARHPPATGDGPRR